MKQSIYYFCQVHLRKYESLKKIDGKDAKHLQKSLNYGCLCFCETICPQKLTYINFVQLNFNIIYFVRFVYTCIVLFIFLTF